MTNTKVIKTLRLAQAEVEWEYPMDIAAAIDVAVEALEKAEKYRWHDLMENPDDLPEEGKFVICQHLPGIEKEHSKLAVFHEFVNGQFIYNWDVDTDLRSDTFGCRYYGDVIAWKYLDIEPFEEENDD